MEYFERKLIETIKQYKCLYDTHDAKYKNILYRERIWTIISESLNVDVAFCKKKWRSLRDINRRCRRHNLSASDSATPYPKKQWKHTVAMKFLNDIKQERTETNNTQIEESTDANHFAPSVIMISTPPSFEILPPSPSDQLQECSRFSPTTEYSPSSSRSYSSHSRTNKKRKRGKEDEFTESMKLSSVNVNNLTRPVTEISRDREPIQRYFSVLAQEIVNANVPLSIQRSIFKGCQKLTYSVLENYEFS